MKSTDQLSKRRKDFPSLTRKLNGIPLAYFDGPAGSQVPKHVIDAIGSYYKRSNANACGTFVTSVDTDKMVQDARSAVATFLGATDNRTISFGANMTTLNFSLSKAVARALKKGDEVVITQLDHEANRGPWLALQDKKTVVNEVRLRPDGTLDFDDFEKKINKRTRLVAMGLASNALGTVNDVRRVREWTRSVGAWLLVDAVHYAPHFSIDVASLDVDFLLCSAYKFYGPHVGVLYTRAGLLDQLETDCLTVQNQSAPYRIETGTLDFPAIAGVKAAIEYLASIGQGKTMRSKLENAYKVIHDYEYRLAQEIFDGLKKIPRVTIYGPAFDTSLRAPTISFTVDGLTAKEICKKLARKGICAWDGHFYAIRAIEVLGLLEKGGVTRVGVLLYNTREEVRRLLTGIRRIVEGST
jgi:cysteine desulfurase family protein (TIGR01976 family)